MLDSATIAKQLAMTFTDKLPLDGDYYQGKVRDNYTRGKVRTIVVTDRVSAFDRVLTTIPFKGQVLNQMAAFWFGETRDIVANHVISVPDPNVMRVRECEPVMMEMVVRAYLTGTTTTSIWHHYRQGGRHFAGNPLPDGMRKDQKLTAPILTPSTKAEQGEHDETVSPEVLLKRGVITADEWKQLSDISLRLFARGTEIAARQGIILVDTKYEFGRLDGKLVLIDEIHTPDSSRFWFADDYQERFERGISPRKIDKDYLREWLSEQGFTGDGEIPAIPDDVRIEAARRYIEAYELITGQVFSAGVEDPALRIRQNLNIG